MGLKRRKFLQRASLALGALGISEAWWWRLQSRYSTALAQTTGRKLALLIGINEYPDAALSGCVTDVEMQQELLVHKFGFLPTDILTLTNKQATRENIETAFINHLTNQAKPDDLVLFHFSGYGSRVSKMINENEQNEEFSSSKLTFQNTLVPIDAVSLNNEGRAINDVLEETLWLLVQSLDTTKVVTVLDTSYVYPGQSLQGFLRVRSRPSSTTEQINKKEKAMQTLLRDRLSLERRQPINQSQLPGLILNASRDSQFATETDWNGFSSGLFTYALTQNLWHTTPATKLQISFAQSTSFVEQLAGTYQQPELKEATQQSIAQFTKKATITPVATPYQNLLTSLSPPASGVVNSVEDNGKTATLWLGGLPINVLDAVTYNSLFTTVPSSDLNSNNYQFKLQIRSRSGLKAKASIIIETNNSQELSEQEKQKFENGENLNNQTQKNTQTSSPNPQLLAGEMVREKIRILPKPTELTIALDRELSRIERVDATSGFSAESQVTVVNNIQAADYIFSRVPETTIAQSLSAPLPSMYQGRYALFSLGEVLIPSSVGEGGEGGEAVKVAVQRLSSQLKTLLAAKILRLTRNESSTQIKVRANFATITPEAKIVMRRETLGVSNEAKFKTNIEGVGSFGVSDGLLTLPIGSRIQCRSYNDGDRQVYFMLFSLDSSGHIFVLDPAASNQPLNNNESSQTGLVISPEDSVNMPPVISNFPRDTESFGWKLIGPKGLAESLIICSHQPFKETIAALNGEVRQARNDGVIQEVLNPLNVAQAVLRDLQSASQSAVQSSGLSTDDYALDINSWATMSFLCRIV
ncbi:caspase family protein [Okeania hirsuta]|uniref:caspase family protein n=1 Tax=Okeania hirsuta TaxID=1458930 RepID=UPI000F53DA01|nr:caspase family protein [Okeania hirsuta]RQH25997.1 caspase family protein [Okeania hirsuta]